MYGRTLFPHGKSRGYHERLLVSDNMPPNDTRLVCSYQRQTLDKERPKSKESLQNKPREDAFDL